MFLKRQADKKHTALLFCISLIFLYLDMIECIMKGSARTQDPTPRNYTAELRTFVVIACVSSAGVQWHRLNMNPHPARST